MPLPIYLPAKTFTQNSQIPLKFTLHKPRPIRFLEMWQYNDWRLKIYTISDQDEYPEMASIWKARALAGQVLPEAAISEHRYGVGFIIVHAAEAFNQITIDWWEHQNELRHHVFKARPESPLEFKNITASGEAFCIWELWVIGFERDAWMQHLLSAENPDLESYLGTTLSEDV